MPHRADFRIPLLMLLVVGGSTVALLAGVRTAKGEPTSSSVVTASEFRLIGKDGVRRAGISVDEGGRVTLELCDGKGGVRLSGTVLANGEAGLGLRGTSGTMQIAMLDSLDGPELLLQDRTGKTRASVSVGSDGVGRFTALDAVGQPTWTSPVGSTRDASESVPQQPRATPTSPRPVDRAPALPQASSPTTGTKLDVEKRSDDGRFVVTSDGRVWEVDYGDRSDASSWNDGDDLIVLPDGLLNSDERSRVAARVVVAERGHWIRAVTDDGSVIVLEDGSTWQVAAVDRIDSTLWLAMSDIVVVGGGLLNTDDGEFVEATRLR